MLVQLLIKHTQILLSRPMLVRWKMVKILSDHENWIDEESELHGSFTCKRRAYGAIEEKKREDIVIPALGYIYCS